MAIYTMNRQKNIPRIKDTDFSLYEKVCVIRRQVFHIAGLTH
jgi:hypothetical protein